jgi:hypothetical protein
MCGLFGWTIPEGTSISEKTREDLFIGLAIGNSARGQDSWGAYAVVDGESFVRREARSILCADFSDLIPANVLIGHTRLATTGAVTRGNAHPFTYEGITLAHNGMIYNHKDMNRIHGRKCTVDSEHLLRHLAEGRPYKDLLGYGAISYVRADEPQRVLLSRLSGGELAVARLKVGGVVWSSDKDHLEFALDEAELEWTPYKTPEEGLVYHAGDQLYHTNEPSLVLGEQTRVLSVWDTWEKWGEDDQEAWRSMLADDDYSEKELEFLSS